MSIPNILFKGIPRTPTRGYTAEVIQAMRPDKVVVPCCGSFSLAWTALEAGFPMADVECGDVSLYSTALGNAIMGQDWRLEVVGERGEIVEHLVTDPVSKAAAVLFMLRVLQQDRKKPNYHVRAIQRELVENASAYVEQLIEQVEVLREHLEGLTYCARDMWETLDLHRDDPGALLLVNPPRYDGGYERMFRGLDDVFDWDPPAYATFKERDYAPLMDLLVDSAATTLMYYATPDEDPSPLWGEPWRAVFADRPGNSKHAAINWIISNRNVIDTAVMRARFWDPEAKYPLFKDQQVTEDVTLWVQRLKKPIGDYYRDLFIHKLEGSLSETYAGIFIDGYLLSVAGIHLRNFRVQGDGGHMTFAFTAPHETYARIHKLTLMSVVSTWFWDHLIGSDPAYLLFGHPHKVSTVMLTPYPEAKTARGVLNLIDREKLPDGSYHLKYEADVVERTPEETVSEWLRKYSKYTR